MAPPTISAQPRGVVKTIARKSRDRGRRRPAEEQRVERAGGDQPAEEDDQQQPRDHAHVVDRRALATSRKLNQWTSSPASRRRASS